MNIRMVRAGIAAMCVMAFAFAAAAAEITLTVSEGSVAIADQLANEGKSISDGDTLVKDGAGTLVMDEENGALLAGGTVKAGILQVTTVSGFGKKNASWTINDDATVELRGSGIEYSSGITVHFQGTGVDGNGAIVFYNSYYLAASGWTFILDADATVYSTVYQSGIFTKYNLYPCGHTLTMKGSSATAGVRHREGGSIHGDGTVILDALDYTSGGVSSYTADSCLRTLKLINGSFYRINSQVQFDAYSTIDGEDGTTVRCDGTSTLASSTLKNVVGAFTLHSSLTAVTISGAFTARSSDFVNDKHLTAEGSVSFGENAVFDIVTNSAAIAYGVKYTVATAAGGFSGSLPTAFGVASDCKAVLELSDDSTKLYATFQQPEPKEPVDFGDVLAWYRFDDRAVGSELANGAMVVNEVDRYAGRGNVKFIDKTSITTTGVSPRIVLPAECDEVYDPLTGVCFTNSASIEFRTDAYSSSSTKGAAVVIPGDESNTPRSSATLEAFICSTGGVYNLMVPIVGQTGEKGVTGETISLLASASGHICARYLLNDDTGATAWGYTSNFGPQLFDGRWHHVALTYNIDDGNFRLYVDYALVASKLAGCSGLRYADSLSANIVFIGGYDSVDARKFNGRIDEVRIVGAALEPSQFLRRRPSANSLASILSDDDTLFFVPMNGGRTGEAACDTNVNLSVSTATPSAYALHNSGCGSMAFSDDAPAPGVRRNHRVADSAESGALDVGGNCDATGTVIVQSGYYQYFDDDFTIEGSFKTSVNQDNAAILSLNAQSEYIVKLMINESGRFYRASNVAGGGSKWSGSVIGSTVSVVDGEWHYFRVVHDKASRTLMVALDGDVASVTMSNILESSQLAGPQRVCIGGQILGASDTVSQTFTGKIGPVRIKRGKISGAQCLSKVDPAEWDESMRDDVAFHLRAATSDGLLDIQPYPGTRTAGETGTLSFQPSMTPYYCENVIRQQLHQYGRTDGLVVTNTGAVHLENSYLVFRNQQALDCYAQTVEMIFNFESIGSKAVFFRLAMTTGENAELNSDRILAYFDHQNLWLSFVDTGNECRYVKMPTIRSDLEGKWHHLAFSWEEDESAGTTTVRAYLDYQLISETTNNWLIKHCDIPSHSLTIGYPLSDSDGGLIGSLDEFRITSRVLEPAEFIRRVPNSTGMVILVR